MSSIVGVSMNKIALCSVSLIGQPKERSLLVMKGDWPYFPVTF